MTNTFNLDTLTLDQIHDIANLNLRWASTSSGRIELVMALADAKSVSHSGPCDDDAEILSKKPYIVKQMDAITPETLKSELKEIGAWYDAELDDHEQNIIRLLWVLGEDFAEEDDE